jgi:hypothetical protein
MKKLFLIIPFFIAIMGCTTVQQTTQPYDEVYTIEQPQPEVKLNVEAYTNPTLTPYTNVYISLDPFDWHWGSYYYHPTYFYSWYYYPSIWNPYWYEWYPIEPYYYNYWYGYNPYYYDNHHDWNNHDYYYGRRNGYSPNLPPPKQPVEPRKPQLQKPVYSKPAIKQPEIKYGEPRKINVKNYTPPAYNQPHSKNEYQSPSTKTYIPKNYPQQKQNYQPSPKTIAPSSRGGR